ncbi:MAG: hypothetical protein Q9165_006375 [Trypethelium subeluteriae]
MDEPATKRRRVSLRDSKVRDGLKTKPRRASYLSPTKASLARFNPSLLDDTASTSTSRSRPVSRSGISTRGQDLRNYVLGGGPNTNDESPITQAVERRENVETTQPEEPPDLSKIIGSPIETQKPTSTSSQLQPLAPSGRGNVLSTEEPIEEEADLPATPQGLEDVDYDPPPRGILFSSPTKRARRSKSLAQKHKSSPLKPVDQPRPASGNNDSRQESPTREAIPESQIVDVVQPQKPDEATARDKGPPARKEEMSDELKQAMRKRDKLENELHDLTKDVEKLENTICALEKEPDGTGQDVDLEDLIDLILVEDSSPPDPSSNPLPISQALLSFGPFASLTQPTPLPPTNEPPDEPIPSHHPLKLADPLPYLRVFTPFTFTSSISAPAPSPSPSPSSSSSSSSNPPSLTQLHTIHILSPSNLFHASLALTIAHPSSQQREAHVAALAIGALPAWTEPELGRWLRTPSRRGGPTPNDVGSVCWAMGAYWELAVKRARCWARCARAFAWVLGGGGDGGMEREGKVEGGADEEGREEVSEGEDDERDARRLMPYLGRRSLKMRKRGVVLEVRWAIGFDWTGEAESEVGVEYACPPVCEYTIGC